MPGTVLLHLIFIATYVVVVIITPILLRLRDLISNLPRVTQLVGFKPGSCAFTE